MASASKAYVLDTNALLNDPEVVYSFSGSDVIIPAVVIYELDKIKRRRSDRRIRFHGRKATRLLMDLSKQGRLVDGIDLGNGSRLRIVETPQGDGVPPDLDLRRPDDQILALAWTLDKDPGRHATLVSNDLNLLLRAELLGLATYRFEGRLEDFRERRVTPMEWFRAWGVVVLLALMLVGSVAVNAYFYASRPAPNPLADLNLADNATILRGLGVSPEVLEDHYLSRVADDPNDVSALVNLGNLLFEQERYVEAAGYYRNALDIDPSMVSVRTDLGIVLLQLGRYQEAITAFEHAVEDTPDDALPHYNLGVALAQGGETQRAIAELEAALRLVTPESSVPVGAVESMLSDLRGQLGGV